MNAAPLHPTSEHMDFLTSHLPMLWIALLAAALIFHLIRLASPNRWLHACYASSAIGLIALIGARNYGWDFVSPTVSMCVFLVLFALVAVAAARRRAARGAIGLPWMSALIQLGAVAYMFAPAQYWKPPLAFLLLLYFAAELISWLRGQEEESDAADDDQRRPPLFPNKRQRGPKEIALAASAAAMVYLLAVGPRAPVAAPQEPQQEASAESAAVAAESVAPETATADATPTTSEPPAGDAASTQTPKVATAEPQAPAASGAETPAAPGAIYTVLAGDTFKSIAKRLFGDRKKWRAIADANPDVKGNKLRAGQVLKVPDLPQR